MPFRRTPVLWVFPLLLGLLVGSLALDPAATWPGWWQRTTVQIHTATLMLLGTATLAASAWLVAVARARGLLGRQAAVPRTGPAILVRLVAPVWIASASCCLALLLVASIRSSSQSNGLPSWPLVALTVAFLLVQSAFGAVCGMWLPRFVAPVVAVVFFMVFTSTQWYVTGAEVTWGRLLPILQQPFWDPTLQASTPRILLSTFWLVAFAALLFVIAGLKRPLTPVKSTRALALLMVSAFSLLLVLVTVVPPGSAAFADQMPPREDVMCEAAGGGQVCVRGRERDLLPTFRASYQRLESAIGTLDAMPRALKEEGLELTAGDSPVTLIARHPSVDSILLSQAGLLVAYSPSGCPRTTEPSLGQEQWSQIFGELLLRRLGLPPQADPYAAVQRLERSTRAVQDDWIERAQTAVSNCAAVPRLP